MTNKEYAEFQKKYGYNIYPTRYLAVQDRYPNELTIMITLDHQALYVNIDIDYYNTMLLNYSRNLKEEYRNKYANKGETNND